MNSYKLIIVAFAAIIAATGAHDCPRICPDLLDPICATDGTEYVKFDNPCEMSVFNCKRERSMLSTYSNIDIDWCTTTELKGSLEIFSRDLQNSHSQCMKPCPMILRPVCGSNGTYRKTFSNDCEMQMVDCAHRIQRKNGWRLLKNSSCSI